jgi:sarcosine/dimethylglycine N-methyltransferase
MAKDPSQDVTEVAESYYDSAPADAFYFHVWGGEDIHVGLYESPDEDIATASRRTVDRMAELLSHLGPESRVLDLGAGYGGSARRIARKYGCHVECLNLSEVQNEHNRRLSAEQGLADRITVTHGSFEDVPGEDASFDVVWSQDAFLHSGDRRKVLEEAARVLVPGGELVFTDPMQADDCPEGVLQPVYERIHLDSLGSFAFYREELGRLGFEEVTCLDFTQQLRNHYARVGRELRSRYDEMCGVSTREYVDRMLVGLENWVKAADSGYLAWGILHFRKKPV